MCQGGGVEQPPGEASMGQVSTIGLDIAKRVFQARGADATGRVVFRKRLARAKVFEFFAGAAALSCGAGGVWRGAVLGTGAWQAGPHGAADSTRLREALCQAAEE